MPIETIRVGDLVLSKNEVTGEVAPKPVTDLIRPEPKPLYQLQAFDAGGEAETFHATDDHPWKVEGKGWAETLDLKPGDRIDTGSGADMVVTSLTLTERVEPTYNLTVADWHTFMVGEDQVVVHNANCYKHNYKYHPNILKRALQDPRGHNFPYSFDDQILARTPIQGRGGSELYRLPGTLGGNSGVFEIGLNPRTGIIFHRTFRGD